MKPSNTIQLATLLLLFFMSSVLHGQNKPVYSSEQDELGPGMIRIEATVTAINSAETMCDRPYDAKIVFMIDKVVGKGRSLTQKLATQQELILGLSNKLLPEGKVKAGQHMDLLLKEIMCRDSHYSPFIIVKARRL